MTMTKYKTILESLEFKPMRGRAENPASLLAQFETDFDLTIPGQFRDFLISCGAYSGYATFPIAEPCPCGQSGVLEKFYGFMSSAENFNDIRYKTEQTGGAPVVIPIASGGFGSLLFLECQGADAGVVSFYDADQRSLWTDEEFFAKFPNLDPGIQEYLRKRREGELPPKPEGCESFYKVADSFEEFLLSCKRME